MPAINFCIANIGPKGAITTFERSRVLLDAVPRVGESLLFAPADEGVDNPAFDVTEVTHLVGLNVVDVIVMHQTAFKDDYDDINEILPKLGFVVVVPQEGLKPEGFKS